MLSISIRSDTLDLYLDGNTLYSGELFFAKRKYVGELRIVIAFEYKVLTEYQVNTQSDWLHKAGHLTIDRRHLSAFKLGFHVT